MSAPHDVPMALIATAYHEAGHAVVAYWLGRRVEGIDIDPATLGGGAHVSPSDDWLREVVTALAGAAASGRFDPHGIGAPTEAPGQTRDVVHARNVLQQAFPEDEATGLSDGRFHVWRDVAMTMIGRPMLWHAIVSLAEALQRSGWHLDGPTATAIIEAAIKSESR